MFDKPSTRTRVSFDVAMRQLGGETLVLNSGETQLGRGETIADTARVLSRYVDAMMLRTGPHANIIELADHASVPVINGLTERSHPCQVMADVMTFEEARGPIDGKVIAWVGDANNVANRGRTLPLNSILRCVLPVRANCPRTPRCLNGVKGEGGTLEVTNSPQEAVEGVDAIVTDVWVSMGDKDAEKRMKLLAPYRVDEKLMAAAASDAIFLHCLPCAPGR